jgi:branched-chain amino acid transport system permease protein
VEQNNDLSKLIGISPKIAYSVTHAVSGALAGLAGFLLGAVVTVVPTMGNDPLLKAFIVVVLGGLGSITGTVVGAYAVGFIIAISQYTLGLYWTPVVLFFILIIILTFRPTGLMGERK